MRRIIIVAMLLSSHAFAQQPVEYKLTLTQQDIEVISKAMGEMPMKDVLATWLKVGQQINDQKKAAIVKPEQK